MTKLCLCTFMELVRGSEGKMRMHFSSSQFEYYYIGNLAVSLVVHSLFLVMIDQTYQTVHTLHINS